MKRVFHLMAFAGALSTLAACADSAATAPAFDGAAVVSRSPSPGTQTIGTIVLAAATNPDASQRQFTQLLAALQFVDESEQTNLVELFVNGTDQYTVFAPTDEAFAGLYTLAGTLLGTTVTSIDQLPSELVLEVLLYHVTEGRRAANSVLPKNGLRTIATLGGQSFTVTSSGSIRDGLTPIDPDPRADAVIRSPDLSARNGIVHVIDQVLLPPTVVATLLELAGAR